MVFLEFWGHSEVDETSNSFPYQISGMTRSSASSATTQSSTRQTPIPNEGGTRDESHKRLENIIYMLVVVGLILSLKILFG